MPKFAPMAWAAAALLLVGGEASGSWHGRDHFCAKYDIDVRHDDRRTDGLGHGLDLDLDRLAK